MKHTKTIMAAALAAIAISSVQASTLYIGGSSAYRKTAANALIGAGWSYVANDGTSLTDNGGTHILYTKGSDYISTCWSGSEAGVQSILATNSRPLSFWATSTAQGTLKADFVANKVDTNADASFSDCSANISRYNGAKNVKETIGGVAQTVTYGKPATNVQVGVQSFTFLASDNFPTNKATSISANAARVLFEKGQIPLSLITGDSSDATATVWLTGRNPDSGTRITAFNEVGYGALKATQNYKVNAIDTNTKTITELLLYPSNNINGLITAPGDDGMTSGGDLVKSIAPLASNLVVYGPGTNSVISVAHTNFTATNIVTNPALGVSATYLGSAVIPAAPADNVKYTIAVAGSATKKATFNAKSYYIATNSFTNAVPPVYLNIASKATNHISFPLTVPSTVNYLVTYASVADALNMSTLAGRYPVLLSYNGNGVGGYTDYSTATKNAVQAKIQNGGYSFWNYEWALLSPNASAGASALLTTLTGVVSSANAAPNANVSSLNVKRASDGATIYNK